MKKEIEVIAVNIKEENLISVKTTNNPSLERGILISNISSNNVEYYVYINQKKYYFKINENGTKIDEPSIEDLKQVDSY